MTHTILLRDGRQLEYAEYGMPDGKPVLYFHGFIGSCFQAAVSDRLARRHGIRIIAPNRPGIGRSTPKRFAEMTDYIDDIEELADALHLEEFAVFGTSGGGCFALACAYALPDRVQFAGVASGMGPLNTVQNFQQLRWFRRLILLTLERHPHLTAVTLRWFFLLGSWYPRLLYNSLMQSSALHELDRRSHRDITDILWNDYESIFLQPNGSQGLIDEAHLYFHWGFNLHSFPSDTPVLFWHGRQDTIVPLPVIQGVARHIQQKRTIIYEGGHLRFFTMMDSILPRLRYEFLTSRRTLPADRRYPSSSFEASPA